MAETPSNIPLTPVDPAWGTDADLLFHVVLVSPEIPPNTGSIARVCAATGAHLHLVEPLGFELHDKHLKRAGLDYWPSVGLTVHPDFGSVESIFPAARLHLFSSGAETVYTGAAYAPGHALVFGCETRGLPADIKTRYAAQLRWIPIRRDAVRSINLANAVSIALYEALRQNAVTF